MNVLTSSHAQEPAKRDSHALGTLILNVIADSETSNAFRWDQLRTFAQLMVSPEESERPTAGEALRSPFFAENALVQIVEQFLKEIPGVLPEEKTRLFAYVAVSFIFT